MSTRDGPAVSAAVKLGVFLVVTTLATSLLAVVIGNITFGDKTTYRAAFTDVTGVTEGSDVRIAGVRVGTVTDISIKGRDRAVLTFEVDESRPLTDNVDVAIRYRNLVGERYLALTRGADGAGDRLEPDALIPTERTTEALDLNVLFNGFKPLFEALSPNQTNKLAHELIKVLQGEGGNIQHLLDRTASVTSTLAERDKLIGEVMSNLNDVLDTVNRRDKELSETITTLQRFATGLKKDRKAILNSLDTVSNLAVTTADLVDDARGPVTKDIKQLKRLTKGLNTTENKKALDRSLQILPTKMKKLGNVAASGSYFNFYVCHLKGQIVLPAMDLPGLRDGLKLTLGDPEDGLNFPADRCQG